MAEGRPSRSDRAPGGSASGEGGTAAAIVPQNLIPHIRAAVAAQISNPADAISVDVIGLLFDYIFRDPTIPESTRALFGRLQVPIVKAALLDRAFFADKKHPARMLLDHLADAAVGAANDDAYRAEFEAIARKAIDQVCADFDIDVTVFREADRSLQAFSEQERQHSATALEGDVAQGAARRGGRGGPRRRARAAARPARRSRHSVRGALLRRDDLGRLPGRPAPRARRRQSRRGTPRWRRSTTCCGPLPPRSARRKRRACRR